MNKTSLTLMTTVLLIFNLTVLNNYAFHPTSGPNCYCSANLGSRARFVIRILENEYIFYILEPPLLLKISAYLSVTDSPSMTVRFSGCSLKYCRCSGWRDKWERLMAG